MTWPIWSCIQNHWSEGFEGLYNGTNMWSIHIWWLGATRLLCHQCVSNGDTIVFNILALNHRYIIEPDIDQWQTHIYLQLQKRLKSLGRVMHVCVSKLTITGSDNGLLPGTVIWTIAGILLIWPVGINLFNSIQFKSLLLLPIYISNWQ